MPEQFTRPYFDANIYISAVKGRPSNEPEGWPEMSLELLRLAEAGHFNVHASTFLAAEVIREPGSGMISKEKEAKIAGFLEREFIVWVDVDLPLAMHARKLARAYGLKPADAVHLAAACRAKCDQLLTWDAKNFHKGGRTIEGVLICEPHNTQWPQTLFPDA